MPRGAKTCSLFLIFIICLHVYRTTQKLVNRRFLLNLTCWTIDSIFGIDLDQISSFSINSLDSVPCNAFFSVLSLEEVCALWMLSNVSEKFVCLSATLYKNWPTDLCENFQRGGYWPNLDPGNIKIHCLLSYCTYSLLHYFALLCLRRTCCHMFCFVY